MANLYVKEFDMANPIIIASSPATHGEKNMLKTARSMPGAIVMRNFGHSAGGGSYICGMERGGGVQSHALGTSIPDLYTSFEEYCESVKRIRQTMSREIKLWVSVGHYGDLNTPGWIEKWKNEAREFELAGADAVELHFNTPGVACAQNRIFDFERLILNSVRNAKKSVKIPVMVKLPVEMTDPLRAMDMAVYAGADAVGPTARWKGFTFELDWKRTVARGGGGYSGDQALPIACYTVAEARNNGVSVPIFAGGGVFSAEAAMKLIMAGSNIAQLGSFACSLGPDAIAQLIAQFDRLCNKYGYSNMEELTGAASYLINMPQSVAKERTAAIGTAYREKAVDNEKCIGCGKCVNACWYEGIEMSGKLAAKTDKCIGCGYCFWVCPTKALEIPAGDIAAAAI